MRTFCQHFLIALGAPPPRAARSARPASGRLLLSRTRLDPAHQAAPKAHKRMLIQSLATCMLALLLSASPLAAAAPLADAAEKADRAAVRALVKQRADVNA